MKNYLQKPDYNINHVKEDIDMKTRVNQVIEQQQLYKLNQRYEMGLCNKERGHTRK